MSKNRIKKISVIILAALLVAVIAMVLINHILSKYSVPSKEERIYNLRVYSGITDLTQLDSSYISHDINIALSKYTNWDNLFLSEHFKEKYKNRKNILDDVDNIANIRSGLYYEYGDDVVIISAEKKHGLFDTDESDDITTEYYFKYVLNEAGEIDDLILLKKQDVYTINGEPVDGSEWYGWQE